MAMTTTTLPGLQITRAQVTVWLGDGTSIHVDGKPDTGTLEQNLNLGNCFATGAEREAQMERLLLSPETTTSVALMWSKATLNYSTRGWRGRWWRFKQWLKAFPTS